MASLANYRYPWEKFRRVNRRHPCPICGHDSYCGYNSHMASCMREPNGAFKLVEMKDGGIAYLHWLVEPARRANAVNEDASRIIKMVPPAPVEVRDRVYRDFLNMLTLDKRHRDDLLRRGLSIDSIKKTGYRSMPGLRDSFQSRSICKRLIGMGHDLSGIPGFYVKKGKYGEYWTFQGGPGYFIPVVDHEGRIQALQRRMDGSVSGKYRLFSCSEKNGCTSGTPAHVAVPEEIRDGRIWITEGPLKANIASELLGAVFVGAISANTWRPALEMLDKLMGREKKEVVIAYDMDYLKNDFVRYHLKKLAEELEKREVETFWACWDKDVKGIDDALQKGLKIRILRRRDRNDRTGEERLPEKSRAAGAN
ncbi:MAG: toprim domain-containing protein [Pelotomaculum sp.]|nr:toprim domain-containing protein [Pelotomaculum sp.]